MAFRTLAEAAADVLNKSRADGIKMPMQTLSAVRGSQPLDNVVDLGGATHENPEGNAVGKVTAAHRPDATPPGVKPADDTDEPMHDLEAERGAQPAGSKQEGSPKTSPKENNGPKSATGGSLTSTEYMHPTIHGEETEVEEPSAEEIEALHQAKLDIATEKMRAMSVKEDIDAIMSGQNLSEEFKTKLSTIFESAVIARAVMVVEQMEQEILEAAEQSVNEIKNEIEEQVDTYLTMMVEEWKAENALAIETGLKAEIVEDFMNGLRNLFIENYIDIPSDKVDVVTTLEAKVAEVQEELNNTLNTNAELTKKINEATKKEIIGQVCEGLTATQATKVKALAEGVEFTTDGEYKQKLQIIRESYFNPTAKVTQGQNNNVVALTENIDQPVTSDEPAKLDPLMARYVEAISRTQR